jgi:BolA family transcriptional regulator, general stress-responsive regulator
MQISEIETTLSQHFNPTHLTLTDESHLHVGHHGMPDTPSTDPTHLRLEIVSAAFQHQSTVQRHRAIYHVLQPALQQHLHALTIAAHTPDEYVSQPPA